MADTTKQLLKPHYIDVGDLLDANYADINPSEINYGDLTAVCSLKELIELSTDAGDDPDRANATVLLRKVQYAESFCDGYFATQYSVPLSASSGNIPSVVLSMVLQVFRYALYGKRATIPTPVVEDYARAYEWLQDIRRGLSVIPEYELDNTDDIVSKVGTPTTYVGEVDRSGFTFNG